MTEQLWIQPTGAALGADVHGVDLSKPLDEATFAAIEKAWAEHLVLRFPGQRLSDDDLMRFSARFGELDRAPIGSGKIGGSIDSDPSTRGWVAVLSNIRVGGRPVGGLGNSELVWHTDMSYLPQPARASVLYALQCPPKGADTWYCNMYLAYDTLPDDLKRAVEGRVCTHDSSHNSAGELRNGFQETLDPRRTPGAVHPLVRLHPVTKRKCLFLGRRPYAYIHGMTVPDSEALLDRLWAHVANPDFAWAQQWRVGDAVIWDNRCTMHRRDEFDDSMRRLMHRTQIVGEPVLAA